MYVANEKELAYALKNQEDKIEVECDLKEKVLRIKAEGGVAWAVCAGAIAIAITSITVGSTATVATGGAATPAAFGAQAFITAPAATTAVSILGLPTTITAIGIALAGGGIGALNQLRDYRMVNVSEHKAILYRK